MIKSKIWIWALLVLAYPILLLIFGLFFDFVFTFLWINIYNAGVINSMPPDLIWWWFHWFLFFIYVVTVFIYIRKNYQKKIFFLLCFFISVSLILYLIPFPICNRQGYFKWFTSSQSCDCFGGKIKRLEFNLGSSGTYEQCFGIRKKCFEYMWIMQEDTVIKEVECKPVKIFAKGDYKTTGFTQLSF